VVPYSFYVAIVSIGGADSANVIVAVVLELSEGMIAELWWQSAGSDFSLDIGSQLLPVQGARCSHAWADRPFRGTRLGIPFRKAAIASNGQHIGSVNSRRVSEGHHKVISLSLNEISEFRFSGVAL
jgi:hypothetical protein